MSKIEGPIEEISEVTKTRFGRPMLNILVGGVRIGKFFKDDDECNDFLARYTLNQNVGVTYSVNGKWKNLEEIVSLNNGPTVEQSTLTDTDNKALAKAAIKVASMKMKDSVTGEQWSRDTVIHQLKKDVKNIREMLESMQKLVEVL